ncbi:MAG: hypothetical protein ACK4YF_07360, partial [Exilispira sp.]
YINKLLKISTYFNMIEVKSDSPYLLKFLDFYRKDLNHFFPFFNFNENDILKKSNMNFYFILRDLIPAGLLIIEKNKEYSYIHIDYVIPAFRDLKIAKFIFLENGKFFNDNGFNRLRTHASNNLHKSYLERIGFQKISNDERGIIYEKTFNF